MNPMKLYRLLQQHAGEINKLVVDLYNDKIDAEAAKAQALERLDKTISALKEK